MWFVDYSWLNAEALERALTLLFDRLVKSSAIGHSFVNYHKCSTEMQKICFCNGSANYCQHNVPLYCTQY